MVCDLDFKEKVRVLIATSMSQRQADKFVQLSKDEQARQIRFAELAKLHPISEWFSDDNIDELRRELDPSS